MDDDEPGGPQIDVTVDCQSWHAALPEIEELCRRVASVALGAGTADWHGPPVERLELSILLTDDDAMRLLNRDYRGHDEPTNVLSFAALDDDAPRAATGPVLLGDVVLAYDTTVHEAAREGKTITQHLSHLVTHGVLHLLGQDHEDEREAEAMERLETAVMAVLGLPDPYGFAAEGEEER